LAKVYQYFVLKKYVMKILVLHLIKSLNAQRVESAIFAN